MKLHPSYVTLTDTVCTDMPVSWVEQEAARFIGLAR